MADYSYDDLDRLLVQVRRIEDHRVKGAEQEIKKAYEELLQELRHYLADTYSQYAEDDRLTYGILQKYGYYARFLEEVERKIDSISPAVKQLIRSTVEMTYAATYDGLVEAVKKAAGGAADLGGLKGCTPDVMKKAVENPVSKLTLDDRLEKHRKEIVYDIKQNISVGLMNGDRYSTVANRIKQSVNGDYKKAIRITRTETHRVRQAGEWDASMEADKQLQENGSTMRITKAWKTMKDERVRPAKRYKTKKGWKDGKPGKYDHKSMEGVTLPVDEEFKLPSGATTQYPGGSGVAGEDINCRCYLSYKLQKIGSLSAYAVNIREGITEDSEEYKALSEAIDSMPDKVQKNLQKGTVIDLGKEGASQYDYSCDILYIAKGADREEIIHEIGHMVENKLMDSDKVLELKVQILKGVALQDLTTEIYYDASKTPVEIFLVKDSRFVSDYQGRIYINDWSELLDEKMNIRPELLAEFISEPFREYIENPKRLEKEFPEFYEMIKGAVE